MAIEFQPDLKYSFAVYPAALIPTDFSNVLVLGVYNERIAKKFINTRELHVNYYPYLPPGTPNDPSAYQYIHIQTQTGMETVVGIAWIRPDSISSTDWNTYILTIQTTKTDAVNKIRAALASNDFPDVTIELAKK